MQKDLILIAESGSTKCDAVIIDNEGREISRFHTMGFNPYFHHAIFISNELQKVKEIGEYGNRVGKVYFYGAGCSSPSLNEIVVQGLTPHFPDAHIKVEHDLTACAFATYQGEPEISCILGTGSNSVYFDGNNIREEVPALAFILGDEGSASYFGKKLIASYFYKTMPEKMREDFRDTYNINRQDVIDRVYTKPHANVYLAGFAPFAGKYKEHPFIWEMIFNGFKTFLEIHVCCFKEARDVPVSFVGSIAYHFQDILRYALNYLDLKEGKIIQKPLNGLIEYHLSNILNTNVNSLNK